MREIKFRAWEPLEGVFYTPIIGRDGRSWDCYRDDEAFPVNDPIMQYTGLKDKNGVEIYEGDIIDYAYYGRYSIEYNNTFAQFETACIEKSGTEMFMYTNLFEGDSMHINAEVIGNVYENPELLEKTL